MAAKINGVRVCPNLAGHTPCPDGYVDRAEWAEEMIETHDSVQCPGCGLYAIFVPKPDGS